MGGRRGGGAGRRARFIVHGGGDDGRQGAVHRRGRSSRRDVRTEREGQRGGHRRRDGNDAFAVGRRGRRGDCR